MEVLVIVAILVVLAGTGGVIYLRYLDDDKKDVAKTQVETLTNTLQTYMIKYGDYPPTLMSLTQMMADGSPAYLEMSAVIDPWGRPYEYSPQGAHHQQTGKPDVWSNGPRLNDPNGVIGNWSINLVGGMGH